MTTDQGVLDVQVRVLEKALYSPAYRHNALARAVFEARLLTLRLAAIAAKPPSVQVRVPNAHLAEQARA